MLVNSSKRHARLQREQNPTYLDIVSNNREKTILKIKFVLNGRFICSPSFIMADPLQKVPHLAYLRGSTVSIYN